MTSTPADVPRKVRQLENDVTSIYDMLNHIQKAQGGHSAQLTDLATGQSRLGGTLLRQHNRLDELAAGQEAHAVELTSIQTTLARQNNRLDELATTQAEQAATLAEHTGLLTEHTVVLTEHTVLLTEHGGKLDEILGLLRAS